MTTTNEPVAYLDRIVAMAIEIYDAEQFGIADAIDTAIGMVIPPEGIDPDTDLSVTDMGYVTNSVTVTVRFRNPSRR